MQYRNMKIPTLSSNCSLSVTGTGTLGTKADVAILNIGITNESKSLEEAQEKNDHIYNAIMTSLNDYGVPIENISTRDLSVIRNYDYSNNTFIGYKVSRILAVTIDDLTKLNDIYSLAIENGANDNITVNFTLSNPSYYYNKALKKASQDALSKASTLSKSFGVKYNPIPCKIHENSSSLYSITYPTAASYSYSKDIVPGIIKVTSEVEATFITYTY